MSAIYKEHCDASSRSLDSSPDSVLPGNGWPLSWDLRSLACRSVLGIANARLSDRLPLPTSAGSSDTPPGSTERGCGTPFGTRDNGFTKPSRGLCLLPTWNEADPSVDVLT